MTFRYQCPRAHKRGLVKVSDNWYAALLEAEQPAQWKRLASPPRVPCPSCGASCVVTKVAS